MPNPEHFLGLMVLGIVFVAAPLTGVVGEGSGAAASMGLGFLLTVVGFVGGAFSVAR